MGDALAVTALLLFSCNAFLVRAASARLEQDLGFLVALATTVVVTSGAVLHLWFAGAISPPTRQGVVLFLVGGVLSSYLGRRGYFRSIDTLGPSRAAAVQVSNPVFALVFAWALLHETVTRMDLGAMAVALLGLLLANDSRPGGPLSGGRGLGVLRAAAPALLSAACYGLGNVARGAAVDSWSEPVMGGFLGAVAGLAVYATLQVSRRRTELFAAPTGRSGLWLWVCVGVVTIAGQIALIAATAFIPIAVAVAISSALPMVVIPLSILLGGNRDGVTLRTASGAALVVAGVGVLVLT